ncbi:MAG: sigma-70 family RNA polymerase sigma factor [Pirellulales bacterium]|nr:sigma-70 family RNA polymerase sigma factor [Pirellulales bacterium]
MQSDSALVNQVREGQTAAYAELVARYERTARVAAQRVLGDWHAAEDAAQEGFVTAYCRLGSLRDGTKFGPWLLQIVRREALRAAKKRPTGMPIESTAEPADPRDVGPTPDDDVVLVELIERLPVHERLVVSLHWLDGHRTAEIAEITGRSVGTITKQLSRAMARLRRWARREESRP